MKNLLFCSLLFLFSACSSGVHYVGENLDPVESVDVYYSLADVKRAYKTIGKAQMNGGTAEKKKRRILQKAKLVGADGVVFLGFGNFQYTDSNGAVSSGSSLSADFIKYLD